MPLDSRNDSISMVFMTADTKIPTYLPYPVFLLDMKISMTAKAIYALLLRRSNLSQLNHWEDDQGRVFIIYPIDAIAADLHKGRTTVKHALKELESCGLLERHHQTAGTASLLYVRLPKQDVPHQISADGQYKDSVAGNLTQPQGRNQPPCRSGNSPPDSRISDPDPVCFPASNNKKEISDSNNHNDAMIRTAYGRYENIFLSDQEYQALLYDYADELSRYIEELSCYLAAAGRTYKNYEAGIRFWALRDRNKKKTLEADKYNYSEEDSLCV